MSIQAQHLKLAETITYQDASVASKTLVNKKVGVNCSLIYEFTQ